MIKNRPPRLDFIYADYPVYFVTFCTRDRQKIPSLDYAKTTMEKYGQRGIEKFDVALGRYVIMPDHVHLFVCGHLEFILAPWVGGLKRAISAALRAPRLWQPGFFDHVLRNNESYDEKWQYVCDNPVRARLVETADDWPYQGEIVLIDRS